MIDRQSVPFAGIVIALVAGAVMIFAGSGVLLVLAVMLVWIGTFWLVTPPPPIAVTAPHEGVQLTATGFADLIEHSGLPMFMLDNDRIVVANAAAREAVGTHTLGQDARVVFRHPAAVELLSDPLGGSATIEGLTGPGSSWQMSRQPIDGRYSLIELVNRTAEIDVSRAHTDFVANASHELRTPLSSIIGYVETLVDSGPNIAPEQANRFHTTVLREARRLQSLVSDLMSLSRVEAEKHDHPRTKVDLVAATRRAARDAAGPDRTERLDLAGIEGEFAIHGDANQLEQLVRNLVDNALKYGEAGTPVSVSIRSDTPGKVLLSVRDRGEGIPAEHIPHLTRRFYRTDPGRSRAAGGTGLGLAIVKHIVERHRGRMDISSRIGEGTTVTVALPLAE